MVLFKAPFVDRALELSFPGGEGGKDSVLPLYVYVLEGCGKTCSLKELIGRLRDEDFVTPKSMSLELIQG